MIGYLFNYIPWWLPYVIVGVALIATVPYWGPVWSMLPKPARWTLGALGAGIGLWWMGRNQGAQSERDQLQKRQETANRKREEIHRDVQEMDRPTVDRELGKYYRD